MLPVSFSDAVLACAAAFLVHRMFGRRLSVGDDGLSVYNSLSVTTFFFFFFFISGHEEFGSRQSCYHIEAYNSK